MEWRLPSSHFCLFLVKSRFSRFDIHWLGFIWLTVIFKLCMNCVWMNDWLMRKIVHVWWNWSYSCMPAQNTETFYLIQHSMNDLSNILLKIYIWYLLPSYFLFFFSVWTLNIFFFFAKKFWFVALGIKILNFFFHFFFKNRINFSYMWCEWLDERISWSCDSFGVILLLTKLCCYLPCIFFVSLLIDIFFYRLYFLYIIIIICLLQTIPVNFL